MSLCNSCCKADVSYPVYPLYPKETDKCVEYVSSNDLLACPFCGEGESIKPTILPTTKGEPWKAIKCQACGATGPMSKSGLEANRLWNRRAT